MRRWLAFLALALSGFFATGLAFGMNSAELEGLTSYDALNRATEAATMGSEGWIHDQQTAYDYRTRRVLREEHPAGGSTTTTSVVFSGGTSAQEYSVTSSTAIAAQFYRGSDWGGGVGGLLYSVRGTTPSYKHYDARGDVVDESNSSGTSTWQGAYEAFGSRLENGGTASADRQRGNTKEEDPLGFRNDGFRYYDLTGDVYITRDPAGFVDGPNVYTYVVQNPWSKFDPEGLSYWGDVGDVLIGEGRAVTGLVTGTAQAVMHPVQTAQGLASAVAHPINTANAVANATVETWNSGNQGKGEVIGNVLLAVASAVAPAAEANNASKLAKAGEVGNSALRTGAETTQAVEKIESGVYHIEANGEKYTGSAQDIAKRLSDPKHPAADLLKDPNVVVEKTPVDVSHLSSSADKTRALRVVEQDVMDAKRNIPKQDGSLNQIRALTEKKQDLYRPLLNNGSN